MTTHQLIPAKPAVTAPPSFTPVRGGLLQRQCACGGTRGPTGECEECRTKRLSLQRRTQNSEPVTQNAGAAPAIVHEVLRSPGRPLDPPTRAFMEPRFGHDFSHVRVHDDAKSAESARAVDALAFTVGRDVVFGPGQFAPGTTQGKRLLAHELTHVLQQGHTTAPPNSVALSADGHPTERQADEAADRILGEMPAKLVGTQLGATLSRKVAVDKPSLKIPNPSGKGLDQTNAQTVQDYLNTLCSGGSVVVDGATGEVKIDKGFCTVPVGVTWGPSGSPAQLSKTATGCGCICDLVGSANDYTIVVDDKDWPHTSGRVVTTPSPNSPKLWGEATISGKAMTIDPWLVLGHELCGHAWLAEKGLPDNNANRGEGGHQEAVARENLLHSEHGIEARGSFKDPYCGESFSQDKAGPGPVEWSSYLKICEAWRKKTYGGKYKISDKIP